MRGSGRGRRAARLSVAVTDSKGRRVTRGAAAGLGIWLSRIAPASARGRLAIAVVSDGQMKQLNRRYRRQNKTTDVLSFPPGAPEAGSPPRFLGDLAIARGMAARQARQCGHSTAVELRVLALHGLLHLLGYDHDTDRGEMGRLEERLRRRAGLPPGLIAR
jgi:probable rRNA maturation factor